MRARLKLAAVVAALLLLLGGGLALFVLRSEALRERIRARVVRELETATGAKAELKRFDFDWLHWRVWVEGLALHGLESPEQVPYVVIPRAELGLTIRSWFSRDVELSRLTISKPEVHIYVGADGKTNIPSPGRPSTSDPIASLLKLKIKHLSVQDGVFEYDSRRLPLRVEARDFDAQLDWEQGPQYRTRLKIGALTLPVLEQSAFEGELLLRAGELQFERLRISRNRSWIEARGAMRGFRHPVFDVPFRGSVEPGDIPGSPIHEGRTELQGVFRMDESANWDAGGKLKAEGLGYRSSSAQIRGIGVESDFSVTANELVLRKATARTIGSTLRVNAVLRDWRHFEMQGAVDNLELDRAWAVASRSHLPWSGILSGPVAASGDFASNGVAGMVVSGELDVRPEPGHVPVTGRIKAQWLQASNSVDLDTSHLQINGTRVSFRGVLGRELEASMISSAPSDLEPVIGVLFGEEDFDLPIDLAQGQATVTARILGPLDESEVKGTAHFRNLVFRGVTLDRVDSDFEVSSTLLALRGLTAVRNSTTIKAEVRLPMQEWKVSRTGAIAANVTLADADAAELQTLAGIEPVLQFRFGGRFEASGSLDEPNGALQFSGTRLEVAGESFGKVSGGVKLQSRGEAIVTGNIQADAAQVSLEGQFRHPNNDWQNGSGVLKLSGKGLELASLKRLREVRSGIGGSVAADGSVNFTVKDGKPRLERISAAARSDSLTLDGKALGSARIEANTVGEAIGLTTTLVAEGRRITGSSLIQLDKDYSAEGVLRVPRLPFALLNRLATVPAEGKSVEPLPVQGFIEGEVIWKAPLADPARGSAQITVSRLQVRPRVEAVAEADIDPGELVVRNNGPLQFTLDSKALAVRAARLQALNTDLTLSGHYLFGTSSPWSFALNGTADLAIISNFAPGIVANGKATIDGSLRGGASDPLFSGKMRISNASFFLRDFPNGIENAEGTIVFERNRANIEKLTGRTGGGQFEVRGFLGLNQGESTYRLQAKAGNVRVRYPEGVSTTLDADLSLTGSSTRSLLSGNVTVLRTGFNPKTDFASVVGSAGSPIPAPVGQNEFLRNLLFDIRIRSAPNATIQSSYTQDLTAEADLRLRGSPAKPVLLGSVQASQGDVNFFGNRYTVSRGEILFYNVATIQPTVDLNLETRIRGVTVFISVSGPLSKLNVSYRSEPPLLSTDIFALLTVGRAPMTTGTTLPSASDPNRTPVPGGTGNSLLGVALSSAVSSRVEKFFGKSRIKIDPQMTGVENVPQARLTIEQSISRDVTLTLVTNLARTQQQVVRLEWDINREWQLIVVRDENGVFGADFAYRKRFK